LLFFSSEAKQKTSSGGIGVEKHRRKKSIDMK
jgi:hypothetical protein